MADEKTKKDPCPTQPPSRDINSSRKDSGNRQQPAIEIDRITNARPKPEKSGK